jgi:hypothetical protein
MLMLLTSLEVRTGIRTDPIQTLENPSGGVYLAQSWQGTLHADLRWSEELE